MVNKKKYKLANLDTGQIIVLDGLEDNVEPRNWQDSEFTYKRSVKTLTETKTYSKNLEFTLNGAKFMRDAYFFKDVEAKVQLFEIRFHPITAVEYEYFIGDFDFSKYKSEATFVSCALSVGGLSKLISSKGGNKFELDRTTDINGEEISELRYKTFEGINRPLFLNSLAETNEIDNYSTSFRMRFGSQRYLGYYSLPLELKYESDDSFTGVPNDFFSWTAVKTTAAIPYFFFDSLENNRTQLFYYNSDRDKTLNVTFDLDFNAIFKRNNNLEENFGSLALITFKGGEEPVFNPTTDQISSFSSLVNNANYNELISLNSLVNGSSRNVKYNQTLKLEIEKGDSLGLFVVGGGEFDQFSGAAVLELDFRDIKCSIEVNENSKVIDIPRNAEFVFNNDAGDRLLEILTGEKGKYRSDFFSSGDYQYTGITSGAKIRSLNDGKISTSLKDFLSNTNCAYFTGYNTEFVNGKEILVHEELPYFFRPETVIKIPKQVSNVKRSVANDFIFSTLKLGYKKPSGDNLYEEVQGLNEYNTINEYLTPITINNKEYNKTSPYRADSEGKELTYRQHQTVNPTGDYRTDNDIFNLDLKPSDSGIYKERVYSDDLEELPKNVFSPDTATGLRITPYNILEKHSLLFNNAYTKFDNQYIRYTSSIGNSSLITKKTGEEEKAENGDYKVNELKSPIFVSQWVTFEYPLDFDLLNMVNGKTLVNNKEIPNTYFKVEFINEFNQKEYGYLFELKPNKEGKWKILKAV